MTRSVEIERVGPERISATELAEWLNESKTEVERMAERGEIPRAAKLGRWWTFDRATMLRFARKYERQQASAERIVRPPTREKVYVVRADQHVKIGTTRDVPTRMRSLQTANPGKVELLATLSGDASVEARLHRRFAAQAERGEWFRLEGELASWIERGCPL